jgi:hypothetical protein
MIGGLMLFTPSHALEIVLSAIRQNPEHAEGILLGMLAAVNGYETMIGQGMREAERTAEQEPVSKDGETKVTRPGALARAR